MKSTDATVEAERKALSTSLGVNLTKGFDSSPRLTTANIADFRSRGYAFAIRYYSLAKAENKVTLTRAEAQEISSDGLMCVTVYQFDARSRASFILGNATRDAERALVCAAAVGQPHGTPIYFGVDYNANPEDLTAVLVPYFRRVSSILSPNFTAGVYGSGLVCKTLLDDKSVTHSWLSQSTSFRGTSSFTGWNMRQLLDFDDKTDPDLAKSDFGGFIV
jgi:hypothetical protein